MTRANLNFISQKWGEKPKTLYWYYNGDQYPTGIRDYFNILEWLEKGEFTSEGFSQWIAENYSDKDEKAKPREIYTPCIFYDSFGFITDYSYVFDGCVKEEILVYEWDKQIFSGKSVHEFIAWLKAQKT
jgi:hypothetical protein